MKTILAKHMRAYLVAACMTAQPAFAAVTDLSSVPLGSAAGLGYLPNLLFILDDSGSMARDFNPDYVNDNNSCMTTSGGATNCQRGDPPYEAGGENGFNGVGYDPNFSYLPGLTSNGQPVLNPPSGTLATTAVSPDAYLGGTAVNITTSMTDKRYCNANNVCKRNGADNASGDVTPAGTDATGNALAAGQFPYRTHASNSSTQIFGLPEMMSIGTFVRRVTGFPNSTVVVTTVGPHGLATGNTVFTSVTNMAVTCAAVTTLDANRFTYTSGGTTTQNRTGFYRPCSAASFSRSGSIVTVTFTGHGLVTNDIITTSVSNTALNVASRTVTVVDANTFTYTTTGSGTVSPTVTGAWVRDGLYNVASTLNGPAVAYQLTPIEHCRDPNLTDCIEVIPPATPPVTHPFPAHVRFCRTQNEALAPGAVSFIATTPVTNRCQLKFVNGTGLAPYIFPRYGWFTRDSIKPTMASYVRGSGRTDCAGVVTPPASPAKPFCTYNEEIQNYAKWHAYYRTRMQMMKTASGRSFLPFISSPTASPPKPDRLRVGFITINPGSPVATSKYLRIDTFNSAQATNWYTKFYAIPSSGSTPLRDALSRAGWIFAGKLDTGLTAGIPAADDPVQASCQKNYSFLTTDGFWNQGTGQDLAGVAIGNLDNVDNSTAAPYASPDFFASRASGTFDGAIKSGTTAGTSSGGSGTLADVALYYFKTDLRGAPTGPTGPATSPSTTPPGGDVAQNNVPAKSGAADFANHQHMNTYTIGLADGLMRYQADYATVTTGDFANIRNAVTAAGNCFWATGTCDWPSPQADGQSSLDDLWHAAVNGRGQFYSAVNPTALSKGLTSALNNFNAVIASAAAAATSSPQVAQGTAKAFSTTYQTATWSGQVYAQNIDPQTGDVITTGPNSGKLWEAHKLLTSRVDANIPRDLRTFDVGGDVTPRTPGPTKLKQFDWASLTPLEQLEFKDKCVPGSNMTQCTTLTALDLITANNGFDLVDYLGGVSTNEGTVFRSRTELDLVTGAPVHSILGDIINSQPVSVSPPFFNYVNQGTPTNTVYTVAEPGGETYDTFKTTHAARVGPLLIGANDGFLHAFNPNTGEETWAYAPRFLLPSLYQLADTGYPGQHRFYVDGTPEATDVFDTTASIWKTIVVGGTNSGGRGYYALDITNPTDPKGLWEFCADPNWCPDDPAGNKHSDPDLGFTYGNPVIGRRSGDGRWVVVVTSGLNNVSPGDGIGYFYVLDAITGKILHKISTGVGDTTTPSGLMKMGAYYPVGLIDPNFSHVYGGNQLGQVWRLDMAQTMAAYPAVTTGAPSARLLANLKDAAGRIQPITARPAGTHIGDHFTRIYYVGTGRYLGNSDLADPGPGGIAWQQSIYGIRDHLTNPDGTENLAFTPSANFRTGTAPGNAVQQTLSPKGQDRTISKNVVDWASQDGFFVDLNPNFPGDPIQGNSPGERVFLDVRLIQGTLIITSNVPASGGACIPGGTSFQYGLDFRTGGYVGNDATATAGQYLPQFLVGAAIVQTADGSIKALNKSITGENITTPIPVDIQFAGKRFSYRER